MVHGCVHTSVIVICLNLTYFYVGHEHLHLQVRTLAGKVLDQFAGMTTRTVEEPLPLGWKLHLHNNLYGGGRLQAY